MPDESSHEKLPLASPAREEDADRVFGGWRTMSPREWVARYSHTVGCSSFDQVRYRNAALQAWIFEVHRIMADTAEVRACRGAFLTPAELAAVEEYEF